MEHGVAQDHVACEANKHTWCERERALGTEGPVFPLSSSTMSVKASLYVRPSCRFSASAGQGRKTDQRCTSAQKPRRLQSEASPGRP